MESFLSTVELSFDVSRTVMPSKKKNIMKENVSGYLENRLGYAKRIKTNQMLTLGSIYGHNLSLV